jgi:nitroimidazol reductase NimA-like FMN-containing flavoprotein (pyridoxamine 5'-phosphate oxidase superfamily)
MAAHPTDHAGLEILPFGDCLRLLDSVPVGRIGFFADGEIVILPVNHLVDGQDVIFRTGDGSKLSSLGNKNLVGFEADAYDARTESGWSVVVSGFTEIVESEGEIRRLSDLGLQSWARAAEDVPTWIRIRPTSITGRRTPGAAFGG